MAMAVEADQRFLERHGWDAHLPGLMKRTYYYIGKGHVKCRETGQTYYWSTSEKTWKEYLA